MQLKTTRTRLLVIGFAAGEIPTVEVNRLLHNIDVVGVGLGAFPAAQERLPAESN